MTCDVCVLYLPLLSDALTSAPQSSNVPHTSAWACLAARSNGVDPSLGTKRKHEMRLWQHNHEQTQAEHVFGGVLTLRLVLFSVWWQKSQPCVINGMRVCLETFPSRKKQGQETETEAETEQLCCVSPPELGNRGSSSCQALGYNLADSESSAVWENVFRARMFMPRVLVALCFTLQGYCFHTHASHTLSSVIHISRLASARLSLRQFLSQKSVFLVAIKFSACFLPSVCAHV